MKLKFFCLIVIMFSFVVFSACSPKEDGIYINGNVSETVEVNTEFIDKGVTYPKNLTLIIDGEINTSSLGTQMIKYFVYSSDGALVKEMHRYVNVVDTTAPNYTAVDDKEYYAGFMYNVNDFLYDYSDNYDSKLSINLSKNSFLFTTIGQHKVEITLTDSSNNSTLYTTTINVKLDIEKLINEVYKSQSYKVSSVTTEIGSKYTRVNIDSQTGFSYFDSGSLHYLQTVTTNLGTYAFIQISAKYGEFNTANVSFHVNGNDDTYSVGFATVDATKSTIKVNDFYSTINNLNLNTIEMLEELNRSITYVLNDFQSYMNNTLHLTLR